MVNNSAVALQCHVEVREGTDRVWNKSRKVADIVKRIESNRQAHTEIATDRQSVFVININY